jgi:hypothetical protein
MSNSVYFFAPVATRLAAIVAELLTVRSVRRGGNVGLRVGEMPPVLVEAGSGNRGILLIPAKLEHSML